MPDICSICRIQVHTSDSFPGPATTLLEIDDRMAEEITAPVEVLNQISQPIGATSSVPRGRGNRSQLLTFTKIKDDHADTIAARTFVFSHADTITSLNPNGTLFGEITFQDEVDAPSAPADASRKSARVHIQSVDPRVTGGTETTTTYQLIWKMP